jgi:hypothetical protein
MQNKGKKKVTFKHLLSTTRWEGLMQFSPAIGWNTMESKIDIFGAKN